MIRLICESKVSGYVDLPATIINGQAIDKRSYGLTEHIVVLTGQLDEVLQHDYYALLALPGYRCMTPAEQNTLRLKQEAALTVEE